MSTMTKRSRESLQEVSKKTGKSVSVISAHITGGYTVSRSMAASALRNESSKSTKSAASVVLTGRSKSPKKK